MTGRIIQIRSSRRHAEQRRRREVEAAMRQARRALDDGLAGRLPLADAIHEANRALIPAVREACREWIA